MKTQKTFYYTSQYDDEIFKVGDEVVLVETINELTNVSTFEPRIATDGIGGNMDNNVKRYHGWRGTTNNKALFAHGLRRILKIEDVEDVYNINTFKITVGKDLHTDWE